ncbi:hypothetical protein [Scytonema hofmannii]|nr:hypothetical protein [Scytonema hofmannii]
MTNDLPNDTGLSKATALEGIDDTLRFHAPFCQNKTAIDTRPRT